MLQLFEQCYWETLGNVAVNEQPGPSTDLKYPDRNVFAILTGKVLKQNCSKKLAGKIAQKLPCVSSALHLAYNLCYSSYKKLIKM